MAGPLTFPAVTFWNGCFALNLERAGKGGAIGLRPLGVPVAPVVCFGCASVRGALVIILRVSIAFFCSAARRGFPG